MTIQTLAIILLGLITELYYRDGKITNKIIVFVILGISWAIGACVILNRMKFRLTIQGIEAKNGAVTEWIAIERIEHYKKGPFTECVYIYTKNIVNVQVKNDVSPQKVRYKIEGDLKEFSKFCAELYSYVYKYTFLPLRERENDDHCEYNQLFDEWFQNSFGKLSKDN